MTVKDKYQVAYSVYETDQYDDFTFLEENRDISYSHVAKLMDNIKEGYEMPPLIVDEHLNVIDGQHRLKAHKQLKKPVRFIIQSDMKENTLQRANTDIIKWTTGQHIDYHAKQGNEHYIKLQEFKKYCELPWNNCVRVLGRSNDPKYRATSNILQYGAFEVAHEEDAYAFADEVILRMRMEKPTGKVVSAIKNLYDAGVDTKRLVTAINVTEDEIQLINTIPKIMETIAKVYNKDLKKSEHIRLKEWGNGQLKAIVGD